MFYILNVSISNGFFSISFQNKQPSQPQQITLSISRDYGLSVAFTYHNLDLTSSSSIDGTLHPLHIVYYTRKPQESADWTAPSLLCQAKSTVTTDSLLYFMVRVNLSVLVLPAPSQDGAMDSLNPHIVHKSI